MKTRLTEKILFALAAYADFASRCKCIYGAVSLPDDPRFNKHTTWLRQALKNKNNRNKIKKALYTLNKGGFIKKEKLGKLKGYELTAKGQIRLAYLKVRQLKKSKLPQGQYLIIFFDIPEKIRKVRNIFRFSLRELGFEMLQRSVWITTYDVNKELNEVIKDCQIEKYVKSLVAKEKEIK